MITDCTNAEMRDALPDLLNGKLAGDDIARVSSHVVTCSSCTSELDLLRTVCACTRVPAIDTNIIASAIPERYKPRYQQQRSVHMWPLAAAAAALIAVASLINSNPNTPQATQVVSMETTKVASANTTGLALVGGIEQLSDENLESLTSELATLEAEPSTEVEPVVFIDEESLR